MTVANQIGAIGAAFLMSAFAMEGAYFVTRKWPFRVSAFVGFMFGFGYLMASVLTEFGAGE